MHYRIIKTTEDFSSYRKPWEELYASVQDATPFQSYAWNREWYVNRYSDHPLFILVIYRNNPENPSLIAPMMIDKKGTLRFIADGHTDYSTFLMEKNIKISARYEIMKTFKTAIENGEEIRSVEMKNIPQSNKDVPLLFSLLDYKKIIYQNNAVSYLEFVPEKDFMKCFGHMTSKQRSEVKRVFKKNESLHSAWLRAGRDPFPEKEMMGLVACMIDSGSRDRNFLNPTLMKVIRSLYENNLMIIHEMKDGENKTSCMNLVLKFPKTDTYLLWIDIYNDTPLINLSSYVSLIKSLCETENETFRIDFGRGLYDYKIKNFLPEIELQYSYYYAKNETLFLRFLTKTLFLLGIKNFYKKNKTSINRILRR